MGVRYQSEISFCMYSMYVPVRATGREEFTGSVDKVELSCSTQHPPTSLMMLGTVEETVVQSSIICCLSVQICYRNIVPIGNPQLPPLGTKTDFRNLQSYTWIKLQSGRHVTNQL